MAIGYLSQEDTYRKLNGTVCFIKNEPVFVQVNRNFPTNTIHWTLFSEYIKKMRADIDKTILVTDKEFSVVSPRLGYVNIDNTTEYAVRMSMRTSAQGLMYKNINTSGMTRSQARENLFYSMGFIKMLKNEYPSFNEALTQVVERSRKSCAFSKDYAVSRIDPHNVGLYFKNKRLLAYLDPKTNVFQAMPVCMGMVVINKELSKHGVQIQ